MIPYRMIIIKLSTLQSALHCFSWSMGGLKHSGGCEGKEGSLRGGVDKLRPSVALGVAIKTLRCCSGTELSDLYVC